MSLLNSAVDYIPVGVFLFSLAQQNFTSIDIDRVMSYKQARCQLANC
jgi:hypothetical protein